MPLNYVGRLELGVHGCSYVRSDSRTLCNMKCKLYELPFPLFSTETRYGVEKQARYTQKPGPVVLERIGGRTLDEKVSIRSGDGDVNGALPFFLPWLLSRFGIRFQFILRLHYVSLPIAAFSPVPSVD